MIRHILFDLDGTLLPMDQHVFEGYLTRMARFAAPDGITAEEALALIYRGWRAMVANDGSARNETVFLRCLEQALPKKSGALAEGMLLYYRSAFQEARTLTCPSPLARQAVEAARSGGRDVYLATNPVFPQVATHARIRWAGLEPEDFRDISSYENSSFCKPNVEYYREFLRRNRLSPKECLMVGNDVREDMAIRALGVPVWLVTDCLENGSDPALAQAAWTGSLAELIPALTALA